MKQKGFTPILVLILIALAVIGYFGYKNYWPRILATIYPQGYKDCLKSPESRLLNMFPEVCITKSGARFTQPLTPDSTAGKFCGGTAGVACPEGYSCKLDGKYPDAGGVCIKN